MDVFQGDFGLVFSWSILGLGAYPDEKPLETSKKIVALKFAGEGPGMQQLGVFRLLSEALHLDHRMHAVTKHCFQ